MSRDPGSASPTILNRKPVRQGVCGGVLLGEHFQSAYLTNDIDRACELFSDQLGVREFRRLEGAIPSGGHIRIELAWVGPIMYELMTTTGSVEAVYQRQPPRDAPFRLLHHHLGYVVRDREQWESLMAQCRRHGLAVPYRNRTPGFLEVCFIDVPWLPHYLEYFCLEQAGRDFLNDVPRHG